MRSIDDPPVELLIEVLSYLGTGEHVECRQVCSEWNKTLRFQNGVWTGSAVVGKYDKLNYYVDEA
jgi:hypothetical protein